MRRLQSAQGSNLSIQIHREIIYLERLVGSCLVFVARPTVSFPPRAQWCCASVPTLRCSVVFLHFLFFSSAYSHLRLFAKVLGSVLLSIIIASYRHYNSVCSVSIWHLLHLHSSYLNLMTDYHIHHVL